MSQAAKHLMLSQNPKSSNERQDEGESYLSTYLIKYHDLRLNQTPRLKIAQYQYSD